MVLDSTTLVTILAIALLVVGVVLFRLPVGTCAECAHCKVAKVQREFEIEERAARLYGIPRCRVCGRHHDPRGDHPA
jgi:hypothetical protein